MFHLRNSCNVFHLEGAGSLVTFAFAKNVDMVMKRWADGVSFSFILNTCHSGKSGQHL